VPPRRKEEASGGVAVPAPRTGSGALAVRGAASRTLPAARDTPDDQVSPARTAKSWGGA
jgi:hypothetical protein